MSGIGEELSQNVRGHFYISGEWVRSHSTRWVELVDPATEEVLLELPVADRTDVDRAIAAARRAFDEGPWPTMTGECRSTYLRRFVGLLWERTDLLTRLATAQVGMPIALAANLIRRGVVQVAYYADLAGRFSFEDRRPTVRGHARVRREPVGVAALISPWNATFPITARKLGAALAAGCTCIVKSPLASPLEGLIIAECADEAGIPAGVVNVITADRLESAQLVASPAVELISFSGSVAAGREIATTAADRMARATLELAGKSAAILLNDADIPAAIATLAPFTMPFSGQLCFAQTRILAPRPRLAEVVNAYGRLAGNFRIGNPRDPQTQIGPVLNQRRCDRILDYIAQGVCEGAEVVTGGGRSRGFDRGYFIDPTVFVNVTADMAIAREEIFGPVVTVQGYDDDDEAISIANDTNLGLSGSIYSTNVERAYALACRVRTGQVGINGLEFAPSVPFGGCKFSGVGREGGPEGLEGFLETKAICMPVPPDVQSREQG